MPARLSFWNWLTGWFAPRPVGRSAAETLSKQESETIAEFCRTYGLEFQRPALVKLALTHRSYLSVTGQGPRDSNERLEFLGDSVLGLVTSEYLYRQHPTEHEGQLTKTKSLLVSKAILSRRALAMGLGRFVLMSHSEIESGGRQRLSILADAFESVVGAIYLDQGFEAAREFIARWLLRESGEIVADKRHTNFKSHLQEFVQSTYRTHPVYRIRSEMGPDHSKQFNVEVLVGKRVLGSGRGRNKKEAEQAAARNALEQVETRNAARRGGATAEARGEEEVGRRSGRRSAPAERTAPAERAAEPRAAEPRATEPPRPRGEGTRRAASPPVPRIEADERPGLSAGAGDSGEDDSAEDGEGRRRRGRRGGRGRRRPEDERPAAPAPASARKSEPARTAPPPRAEPARAAPPPRAEPARTAPPPRAESGRTAPPRRAEPAAEADAHEPAGPDAYPDDFEEVGRPDAPGPGDVESEYTSPSFGRSAAPPAPPAPPSRRPASGRAAPDRTPPAEGRSGEGAPEESGGSERRWGRRRR